MKIGITENGDASLQIHEWKDKIYDVDGAILITKNSTNHVFQKLLLQFQDKIILHATCTFLGSTIIEQHIPLPQLTLNGLKNLINNGFNPAHIVFRIDPIIYESQINSLYKEIESLISYGILRYRFSFCDFYPHVKKNFQKYNLPIPKLDIDNLSLHTSFKRECLQRFDYLIDTYGVSIESCEEFLPGKTKVQPIGCISHKDLQILGLPDYSETLALPCRCLSCKTELLKRECKYDCLYCYWGR